MADPQRRAILTALRHQPVTAGVLASAVNLAPNAVSFHLRTLRQAGLITPRRRGRHLEYQLNTGALSAWMLHVERLYGKIDSAGRSGFSNRSGSAGGGREIKGASGSRSREDAEPIGDQHHLDDGNSGETLPTELL